MTRPPIEELAELVAKASREPWIPMLGSGNNMMTALVAEVGDETEFVADFLPDWALDKHALPYDHRHNMNAVAALRNHAPALLAYVAHLESLAEARGRAVDAAKEMRRCLPVHSYHDVHPAIVPDFVAAGRAFDDSIAAIHKE